MTTIRNEDEQAGGRQLGQAGLQVADMLGVAAISAFLGAVGLLAFFVAAALAR